jgi:hypothetical protein
MLLFPSKIKGEMFKQEKEDRIQNKGKGRGKKHINISKKMATETVETRITDNGTIRDSRRRRWEEEN